MHNEPFSLEFEVPFCPFHLKGEIDVLPEANHMGQA